MVFQTYNIATNLINFANQHGKQIIILIALLFLISSIVNPDMIVFANGASGNASG